MRTDQVETYADASEATAPRGTEERNIVREVLDKAGIAVGLVILVIALTILTPHFLTASNLLNVARQIAMMAVIAAGMTFVIIGAEIDLSVGSIMAFAGAVLAVLLVNVALPLPVAMLATLCVGLLVGLFNGFVTAYVGIPSFVVTLGMLSILRGATYVLLDGRTVPVTAENFRFIGRGDILGIPVSAYILVLVYVISWLLLNRTKYGRWVLAAGSNPEAARLSGINVRAVKLGYFSLLGLLTALSGIIAASRIGSGSPLAGTGMELDAIAAVVLGGTSLYGGSGSIVGTLLGAMVIGVLSNGLNLLGVSPYYQLMSSGVVILIAVGLNRLRGL